MAPLVPFVFNLGKKLSVLDQSLAKIEASKPRPRCQPTPSDTQP